MQLVIEVQQEGQVSRVWVGSDRPVVVIVELLAYLVVHNLHRVTSKDVSAVGETVLLHHTEGMNYVFLLFSRIFWSSSFSLTCIGSAALTTPSVRPSPFNKPPSILSSSDARAYTVSVIAVSSRNSQVLVDVRALDCYDINSHYTYA